MSHLKNNIFSLMIAGLVSITATTGTFSILYADDPVPPVPQPTTPTITIPAELKADVGAFVEISATTNCQTVKWIVLNQQGLNLFPMDLLKDTKTAVAVANKEGVYYLHAWTALNNIPSDLQTCKITIGNPQPPVPPIPPTPIPVPTPTPTKLSVLFLEESSDLGTANYKPYLTVLNSGQVRSYLATHTAVENLSGGITLPSWRRWDKDTNISNESGKWQGLMKVYKNTDGPLPWLIIANEDGSKILSSTVVPNSESATLDLLKKYGG